MSAARSAIAAAGRARGDRARPRRAGRRRRRPRSCTTGSGRRRSLERLRRSPARRAMRLGHRRRRRDADAAAGAGARRDSSRRRGSAARARRCAGGASTSALLVLDLEQPPAAQRPHRRERAPVRLGKAASASPKVAQARCAPPARRRTARRARASISTPAHEQQQVALEGAQAEALGELIDGRRRRAARRGSRATLRSRARRRRRRASRCLQPRELGHQRRWLASVQSACASGAFIGSRSADSRNAGGSAGRSMIGLSMPSMRSRARCDRRPARSGSTKLERR